MKSLLLVLLIVFVHFANAQPVMSDSAKLPAPQHKDFLVDVLLSQETYHKISVMDSLPVWASECLIDAVMGNYDRFKVRLKIGRSKTKDNFYTVQSIISNQQKKYANDIYFENEPLVNVIATIAKVYNCDLFYNYKPTSNWSGHLVFFTTPIHSQLDSMSNQFSYSVECGTIEISEPLTH